MLRRALLLLLLAAPLGAQAAESLTFSRASLGKTDCGTTTNTVTLTWTVALDTSQTYATSDVFQVRVGGTSGTAACSGTQVGGDVASTASTSTTEFSGTSPALNDGDFLSAAGVTCGTEQTVYVCVSLQSTDGAVKGSVTGSIKYSLAAPPVPKNVTVSPGDGALYVSWNAGTSTGTTVAADHYDVTMTVESGTDTTHGPKSFTGTSGRFDGLKNGVTYAATVVAVSAAGNSSDATTVTDAATGTPAPVSDFWDMYKAAGGQDPGGCGGGSAGLLSLIGVAALARTFRRRS